MTASPYASAAKITEACTALGADFIGQNEQTLLQQLVVAAATASGGGGGGAFLPLAGGTMTGDLTTKAAGLLIPGVISGTVTVQAPAVAGTPTITLPSVTSTLATLGSNGFTGAQIVSVNGAASTPALSLTGVPFAGTGTTSFPLLYVNDSAATASTTLNTAGTMFGVNANGTQDLANLLTDGASQFKVSYQGKVTLSNGVLFKYDSGNASFAVRNTADAAYARLDASVVFGETTVVSNSNIYTAGGAGMGSPSYLGNGGGVQIVSSGHLGFSSGGLGAASDVFLFRTAAASLRMGINSATPVAQTFGACSGVGTNIVGAKLSLAPGQSTGNATPAVLALQGTAAGASGTTAQTLVDVLTIVREGVVRITNIPTSSAGLSTGDIYSNAGILTIV